MHEEVKTISTKIEQCWEAQPSQPLPSDGQRQHIFVWLSQVKDPALQQVASPSLSHPPPHTLTKKLSSVKSTNASNTEIVALSSSV